MARTALTGAVNVVRAALMGQKPVAFVKKQMKRASKNGCLHRATILLAHFADDQAVRKRAQHLLKSKFR